MNSPWETLGLDPEDVDKKSAKRAYARLLKKHRPDQDPEKFQEIRQAYEWITNFLDCDISYQFEEEGESEPSEELDKQSKELEEASEVKGEPDSEESSAPQNPETEKESFARSVDAFRNRLPENLAAAVQQMQKISLSKEWTVQDENDFESAYEEGQEICRESPTYLPDWSQAIETLLEERGEFVTSHLTINDMVRELENDCSIQSAIVLNYCSDVGNCKKLRDLARDLVNQKSRLVSSASAFFLIELARLTALFRPQSAEWMIDVAYPNLPVQSREYLVGRVEYAVHRGQIFNQFINTERSEFWFQRFREVEQGKSFDWESEEATEEIELLKSGRFIQARFFDELEDVVPEELLNDLRKGQTNTQRNSPPPGGRTVEEIESNPESPKQTKPNNGCGYLFVLIVLIKVVVFGSRSCESDLYDGEGVIDNIAPFSEIEFPLESIPTIDEGAGDKFISSDEVIRDLLKSAEPLIEFSEELKSRKARLSDSNVDSAKRAEIAEVILNEYGVAPSLRIFERLLNATPNDPGLQSAIEEAIETIVPATLVPRGDDDDSVIQRYLRVRALCRYTSGDNSLE